jgi:hypothetical protein
MTAAACGLTGVVSFVDPAVQQRLYSAYRHLRGAGPVCRERDIGFFVVLDNGLIASDTVTFRNDAEFELR